MERGEDFETRTQVAPAVSAACFSSGVVTF